jgi:hypothetical protein
VSEKKLAGRATWDDTWDDRGLVVVVDYVANVYQSRCAGCSLRSAHNS